MLPRWITAGLIISSTTIGGGILALPSRTGPSGFILSSVFCFAVWLLMYTTGMQFAQGALWSKEKNAHLSTIANQFLGTPGKWVTNILFLFLYYCLMMSFFSGFIPTINQMLELSIDSAVGYLGFGLIVSIVLALSFKVFDMLNFALVVGLFVTFLLMITTTLFQVKLNYLTSYDFSAALKAAPILVGAFGFHNIVPSIVSYLDRDKVQVKKAILLGTLVPLIMYLLWHFAILGILPQSAFTDPQAVGIPVLEMLKSMYPNSMVSVVGQFFTVFAISTSIFGVGFSMVHFLQDLKERPTSKAWLIFLVVAPPLCLAYFKVGFFVNLFALASGFGETLLNCVIPAAIVYMGCNRQKTSWGLWLHHKKNDFGVMHLFRGFSSHA